MTQKPDEMVWCTVCLKETRWTYYKTGKWCRCEGCEARFPCTSRKCGHIDCGEARGKKPIKDTPVGIPFDGRPDETPKGCVCITPKPAE